MEFSGELRAEGQLAAALLERVERRAVGQHRRARLEALRAAGRASRAWLRETGALKHTDARLRARLALRAADVDATSWRPYEFADASLGESATPKLCQLHAPAAAAAAAAADAGLVEGMRGLLRERLHAAMEALLATPVDDVRAAVADADAAAQVLDIMDDEGPADPRAAGGGDDDGGATAIYADGAALPAALSRALEAIEDERVAAEVRLWAADGVSDRGREEATAGGAAADVDEEADDAAAVEALEVQAWLELDALSTRLGYASVPMELLGLLPPPPAAGWPLEFAQVGAAAPHHERQRARTRSHARARRHATVVCGSHAAHLPPSCTVHLSRHTRHTRLASLPSQARAAFREGSRAELQESLDWPMELRTSARYTPTDSAYPALRRASRFSYAIWAVLAASADGVALQPVLEAEGTCERLRMALLRMRELSSRLEG